MACYWDALTKYLTLCGYVVEYFCRTVSKKELRCQLKGSKWATVSSSTPPIIPLPTNEHTNLRFETLQWRYIYSNGYSIVRWPTWTVTVPSSLRLAIDMLEIFTCGNPLRVITSQRLGMQPTTYTRRAGFSASVVRTNLSSFLAA